MVKSKKILALLMAIIATLSVFSGGMISYAEDLDTPVDEEIIEEYSIISSHSSLIRISGVTATCSASLNSSNSASLKIKMELQKKKSGVYETIKTWTDTKTGTHLVAEHTRTINVLSTYRLKTTFTAGSETAVVYSTP